MTKLDYLRQTCHITDEEFGETTQNGTDQSSHGPQMPR